MELVGEERPSALGNVRPEDRAGRLGTDALDEEIPGGEGAEKVEASASKGLGHCLHFLPESGVVDAGEITQERGGLAVVVADEVGAEDGLSVLRLRQSEVLREVPVEFLRQAREDFELVFLKVADPVFEADVPGWGVAHADAQVALLAPGHRNLARSLGGADDLVVAGERSAS